jgi:hypothetical protein
MNIEQLRQAKTAAQHDYEQALQALSQAQKAVAKARKRRDKTRLAWLVAADQRRCRVCGCTNDDCRQCIEKTGRPCYWVEDDLCSVCAAGGAP